MSTIAPRSARASPRGSASSGSIRPWRTCAFLYGLANFIGPGLLLAVLVTGKEEGLSGGEVGLMLSAFGAVSERSTIAVFAAFGLVLALWGTPSPAIRTAPSLDALSELPGASRA